VKRVTFGFATLLAVSILHADDWPMFGGRPDRNMVSPEKGLPTKWAKDGKSGVLWSAALGPITYGNPAVAGGRVFVGTNNEKPRDPTVKDDKGVLMCFSEKDGSFLWQALHDKLPKVEFDEDTPKIGVCSIPCVAGERVYYVSNRAELVCADVAGFADGENDGPYVAETRKGAQDADFVWILDMKKEFGLTLNQASASSPVVVDGRVFVITGQARGVGAEKIANPGAASFIAVDAATRQVLWKDASPGSHILEAQWASPGFGTVDGVAQVCFPGGDGWVYAFEPASGKLLWKFDGKRREERKPEGKHDNHNNYVSTPVYAGHRVIIGMGIDTDTTGAPGALYVLDARKRGDITEGGVLWSVVGKDYGKTISTAAVKDGLLYAAELAGYLHCFELETGKPVWKHDFLSTVWGSPMVADGKIYVQTGDGEVVVLQEGRVLKVVATNSLPKLGHGTVVPANGVLFVTGESTLYALKAAP
jgi:outer membrane protein assembly factor BamB